MAPPEATEAPLFGALDQVSLECIPLHVAQDRIQMVVAFDRERLEPALIKMAGSCAMIMSMPALGVRERQPTKKGGDQLALPTFGPHHKMPVIGHHTIGENSKWHALESFLQNAFERLVVILLLEQREPRFGSIENVIRISADQ